MSPRGPLGVVMVVGEVEGSGRTKERMEGGRRNKGPGGEGKPVEQRPCEAIRLLSRGPAHDHPPWDTKAAKDEGGEGEGRVQGKGEGQSKARQ
eukprot:scaffold2713_cov24-Tisochrysis_lutea.AAC.5